jgi:hypothetical protein
MNIKPLVPTRTGEAPVLAAQRRRWPGSVGGLMRPLLFCGVALAMAVQTSLSEILCSRHIMTYRSQYAEETQADYQSGVHP